MRAHHQRRPRRIEQQQRAGGGVDNIECHVQHIAEQLIQVGGSAHDRTDSAKRFEAALLSLHLGVQLRISNRAGSQIGECLQYL